MKKKPPVSKDQDHQTASDDAQDARIDRRTWLKQAGAVTAAAMLTSTITGCGDDASNEGASDVSADAGGSTDVGTPDAGADAGGDADTIPGPNPVLEPLRRDGSHPFDYIDTVVIVQMENRSFDHYFGALSLLEGRSDIDGLTDVISNLAQDGTQVRPALLSDAWEIHPDPAHGHSACLAQFAEGTNAGFVTDWERLLSPEEYAEKLGWVMGYHTREQLPALYGLADSFTLCDRWFCSLLGPTWPNRFYSHAATSAGMWSNLTPLEDPTVYRSLLDAGHTVGCYHESLVYFMLTTLNPHVDELTRNGFMRDFFKDAEEGTLPNVCVVEPDYTLNDDHPPHDPRLGQAFIQGVYEALRRSPHWDRCLMLVFYDEHGGFHDHVVPPKVEGEERAAEGFDQLGFRVPGIVAGGLARRGAVLSEVIDHASVPSLLSNIFGTEHVNERSRLAGDLGLALDLELTLDINRRVAPELPTIDLRLDARKVQKMMERPPGQPELDAFALRHYGLSNGTMRDRMRRFEQHIEALERLGVARY